MRLKTKLLLGFGGLVGLLAVVSGLSIIAINWYTQAIERVMRENYDSVLYGQRMAESVNLIMRRVQDAIFTGVPQDGAFTAGLNALEKTFEENLDKEHGNITVPGEGEQEDELRESWRTFRRSLNESLSADPAAMTQAYPELLRQSDKVRSGAQRIVDMNVQNMFSIDGQAKRWANRTRLAMWTLLGAGLLFAVVFIAFAGRWILRPIESLTSNVRRIEAGELNLVVAVHSHDEVGELGEAFNAMTARLRQFRRTDEAKLLLAQQTTQMAIDSLPDAVAVVHPDGIIEQANSSARKLFNLAPGKPVADASQGSIAELFKTVRDQQRAHEASSYSSALQVFDGGEERFFLPHGTPVKDQGGRLVGVTLVLVDVTRLRQIDELKTNLVSTVSHELRTPLTSIRLANHLLLSDRIGSLNEKQTEVVVESRDNADRLQRIIENLLDMSRIESGQGGLECEAVSPYDLVMEAVDSVRGAAHEREVDLSVEVPVELPRVLADASRIRHVLLNLLTNALRYTPPGGKITVEAIPGDSGVTFNVRDTGCGIPAEHQPRVFEKFFRVPGQNGHGVGLGLAIAREIVQAHGGTLGVESSEGVGSTFRFTLPRDDAQDGRPKTDIQEI